MFTGIIEGIGKIQAIKKRKSHAQIWIQSPFSLKEVKLGDSIAVDGCCLTVTEKKGKSFAADISPETLAKTNLGQAKKSTQVNLERPLRMGDPLGGHWVQGHVDGTGKILSTQKINAKPQSYFLIEIKVPKSLKIYMIPKGSIALDGISLTVNEVSGEKIRVCIIPHTQEKTTLTQKKVGATLNIEADMMLKFAKKMLEPLKRSSRSKLT